MAVQKKQEVKSEKQGKTVTAEATSPVKTAESKVREPKEEIVASDVIIKTTGNVEIIEETLASPSHTDPLSDFKERMSKEEQYPPHAASKKNFMWPILFIFIAAILILVGVFLYKNGGVSIGTKIDVETVTPTPVITVEPTITVDLTKYEIEIQNGSGIAGEAGRQQANLETEGFTVSSVGNADNSDYTDTIVKAKEEVEPDFLGKLKTVLESSFTTVTEEVLSDDSSVPVVVILGTKL